MQLDKLQITNWFKGLQDRICHSLEELDGTGTFREDQWDRPEGGGGRSRVILGDIIEKGGVNFSAVHGPLPEKISSSLNLEKTDFYATGVSIVLHPHSPFIPIIHMNVRYFETSNGLWWFGGGIDLTPHYINQPDATFFHSMLKATCDNNDLSYYPQFKKWADDYFYIKHRDETRGIGGIFFDQLRETDIHSKADRFDFVKDVGETFIPIYTQIVAKNIHHNYTQNNKDWQSLRRGRYVEFNLVWDRGTKFGLDTNGRTESILMSMPPAAQWVYDYQVTTGSPEAYTQEHLRKGLDWLI
jgi:coproporphyrinogen III oxidase